MAWLESVKERARAVQTDARDLRRDNGQLLGYMERLRMYARHTARCAEKHPVNDGCCCGLANLVRDIEAGR